MENLDAKIDVILRQTNYTRDEAIDKLKVFEFNEINVIKDYFGIKDKKPVAKASVNQEIYKQLRTHLDGAMRDYNKRVENGEVKKVV